MKIAVLADIHGNFHSLQAILADVEKEKPDLVVCAGDMLGCNPYPGSVQVWQTLKTLRIPMVVGNQEDFVIAYHSPAPNPLIQTSIRFMPVQHLAKQFTLSEVEELKTLPMSMAINDLGENNVLICHASPNSTTRSFAEFIDNQMDLGLKHWSTPAHAAQMAKDIDTEIAATLKHIKASVIVGGHLHTHWHQYWEGKLLLLVGSAGLPLKGKLGEVEYLILTYEKDEWQFRDKTIKYDHQSALDAALASNFLAKTGPLGWLLFDEILIQQDHLTPFLREYCPKPEPEELQDWEELVKNYLKLKNRWDAVKPYLPYYAI